MFSFDNVLPLSEVKKRVFITSLSFDGYSGQVTVNTVDPSLKKALQALIKNS